MKTFRKAIGIGIVSSLLIGCECVRDKTDSQSDLGSKVLHGTVFSERYMPASGSSFNAPDIKSRYAFSIDTDEGRKSINVEDYRQNYKTLISKESIDALIERGTVVDVTIQIYNSNQQVYNVRGDKIKVLGH